MARAVAANVVVAGSRLVRGSTAGLIDRALDEDPRGDIDECWPASSSAACSFEDAGLDRTAGVRE